MAKHSANRGILVIESPWELDDGDSNRTSVLPFVEGIAKLAGDTEVYHANFYDKKSFTQALDCLCKSKFKNTIVYISAHGFRKKIGKTNIAEVLQQIGEKSKKYNITGVIFGSCFVGGNTELIEVFTTGSNIRWCSGYSSSVNWLPGTMIDCSIIQATIGLDEDDYASRDNMIMALAGAIAPFDGNYHIGEDYKDNNVALKDSLQFVIQPTGRGKHPKTVSAEVFEDAQQYRDEPEAIEE